MSGGLADALRTTFGEPSRQRFRVGTVSSTSPLEVSMAGGTSLSAARNANYTATVSDTVLILQTETDLIIICKIISGG